VIPADPPGIPTSGPNSDPDPRSARVPPPQVPASQEPEPPADPPHTLIVADVLGHLPVAPEDAALLRSLRLMPPVSGALRAAVDWLAGEGGPSRALRVRADDAALEVTLEHVDGRWLEAAGEVLAAVRGSLGRVESLRPDGPWMIRVPLFAAREQYLMVVEGGIPIAIPWVSVLDICMAGPDEFEASAHAPVGPLGRPVRGAVRWPRVTLRGRDGRPAAIEAGEPAAKSPDPRAASGYRAERPVMLLGHGLKRAHFVVERLVWRLGAAAAGAAPTPPAAALSGAVVTDEGERYWVLDTGALLAPVKAPLYPVPPLEPVASLSSADVEPLGGAPAPPAPPAPVVAAAPPSGRAAPGAPAGVPPTPEPPRPTAAETGSPRHARRFRSALVAEDSLIASIFLTRLLEQQGFLVRAVVTGAELKQELERSPWNLVCVDIELPDHRGADHLREVREALEAAAGRAGHAPPALIALVRDAEDIAAARAAGISRMLRKPFGRGALLEQLQRAGLFPGSPA